jgi:hypothetical protein
MSLQIDKVGTEDSHFTVKFGPSHQIHDGSQPCTNSDCLVDYPFSDCAWNMSNPPETWLNV